jgi:hypothetical protein
VQAVLILLPGFSLTIGWLVLPGAPQRKNCTCNFQQQPQQRPVAIKAYTSQTKVTEAGMKAVCGTLQVLLQDPAVINSFLNVPSGDLPLCATRTGFTPSNDGTGRFCVFKKAEGCRHAIRIDPARVENMAVAADVFALIITGTSGRASDGCGVDNRTRKQPTALNYNMDTYRVEDICSAQASLIQTARIKDGQRRADAVRVLLLGVDAPASPAEPTAPLAVIDSNLPLPVHAPSPTTAKAPRKRQRQRENTPPTVSASRPAGVRAAEWPPLCNALPESAASH